MPLGIAAMISAARVETSYSLGDYHGAMESSRKAGKYLAIGFGIWLALAAVYVAIFLLVLSRNSN